MGSPKSGLLPQNFLGSEAKRMFFDVARKYGGHKVKATIVLVAKELGVSFDLALRARKELIGARAFPKWAKAYAKWDAKHLKLGAQELEALHARIEKLEAHAGIGTQSENLDRRRDPSHGVAANSNASAPRSVYRTATG